MEYSDGSVCSLEELIAFGNRVFGSDVEPGGFAALLPKLVGEHAIAPKHYRVLRENGKLCAMLLASPLTLRTKAGNQDIRYIGSVSVAPEAQKRGLMQELLANIQQEMRSEKISMAVLGGQRQRYGYFGFEPAGMQMNCTMTAQNARHAYRNISGDSISLIPLLPDSSELAAAFQLFAEQEIGILRGKEQFLDLLRTWRSEPYAIRNGDGFAGYLSLHRVNEFSVQIHELCLEGTPFLPALYKAFLEQLHAEELQFSVPLYGRRELEELSDVCEGYSLGFNHSYCILEFATTLRLWLALKAEYSNLSDGEASFTIEGEALHIRVSDSVPCVESLREPAPSSILLSRRQATQWMFSPLGFALNFPGSDSVPPDWFPLPLFLPPLDAC